MQSREMQKWAEQLRSCRTWTREQALDVLQRQRDSGDGVTAFARRMGFVPQRLFWWQSRLPEVGPQVTDTQSFVPVVVRQEAGGGAARISVELGDGIRVDVHEVDAATAGWVALLVAARSRS